MSSEPFVGPAVPDISARATELTTHRLDAFARRCDHIFALLAVMQWAGAIAVALWLSPLTWDGAHSRLHPHVYAAIFLGGILVSLPIFMAWRLPGHVATRHVIAIAQMLWSSLLIHVTGGRIETHFHVFGSLAFLAWYRDWRVVVTAALVTAGDHALVGWIRPESIYGDSTATQWRTVEHAFWVIFECTFLLIAMARSLKELRESCGMQAELEQSVHRVEAEVRRQTAQLREAEERALAGERFLSEVGQIAGIGGWQLDLATNTLHWTDQTCRIHEVEPGYKPTLTEAIEFYAPEARATITRAVQDGIDHNTPWDVELPLITATGRHIYVRAVGTVQFENGAATRLIGAFQDITRRKRADAEIRKLSVVVEQTPASVVITDTLGSIEYINPAFVESTGYLADEVLGKNPRLLKSGLMPPETYNSMWRDLSAGREWRGELQNRRKNGELFWELAVISPLKDAGGKTTHYIALKENITARKAMEDELRSAARTDKLTGLANRALFTERLQLAVGRARRDATYAFAVLFLDFDRFKSINDSLGHNIGDLLLKEIASRLRTTVRGGEDVTARLGGDEFVVLLDAIAHPGEAIAVANRLLETFIRPYHLGEHEVYSTASIGVFTSDIHADSADAVLRDADTAMYEAKLAGKARHVVFNVSMRQRVQDRMNLENELRKALDGGQLLIMYQPIVSLETGHLESFEALVRWQHPERGMISPVEFIPIAEDTGLILPIGEWVLREACTRFAEWQRSLGSRAPRSISVNLSRKQLLQPGLVDTIRDILRQTGVEPKRLHLEVTESTVMQDAAAATRMLHAIKDLGVSLAMDDFGTGHSSLACLHQFPIDVLKIDRSFIANINRGRDFAALVHAVAQLARNLNITVVAEGVEVLEQVVVLQSLECEFAQGYLFGQPMPHDCVPGFAVPRLALAGQNTATLPIPQPLPSVA